MESSFFEVPTQPLESGEGPVVTALHMQKDGSLLCGLIFSKPSLFRVRFQDGKAHFSDLKLEDDLGGDLLGVIGGLRFTTSGDTALAAIHGGFLPTFAQSLAGGSITKKSGQELLNFFADNDGGMGANVRHSVVQLSGDETNLRRVKDPGAILDVAHLGDFIFGLHGTSVWREPYMNSEKRETLRKDLGLNRGFHRDTDGNFWFVGENGRLLRMGQTDIKAKPTPLKFPEDSFELSAATDTEGWCYATTKSSTELYRIRRNPMSHEEESQKVHAFEHRITGLLAVDRETDPLLLIAVEGAQAAEIYSISLVKPEDPELPPPALSPKLLGKIEGCRAISCLTLDIKDEKSSTVWAAESYLGAGRKLKPRLLRFGI